MVDVKKAAMSNLKPGSIHTTLDTPFRNIF